MSRLLSPLQQYAIVTANYWAFTLTDGALRMLVVFHFHALGYSTLEIAFLFLFYEFFGIITNLYGGWLGARFGLRLTLWTGTLLYLNSPSQQYFRAAGSLGWSFPASLGAKCAAPNKPVICFCGDGGFFYHLPELETARRRGIKTVTIVNNNHCLSQGLRNLNIAYADRKDHSRKGECFEYLETDFAKVAQSFGCFGVTVGKPQDFRKAFEQAMASDLPAVIDVKTEFAVQAPLPWVPQA